MNRLYIDLDGVLADFDAHFPALFGVNHKEMLDGDMWARINAHPSYFRDMPLCEGALRFFEQVRYLNPSILTACPKSNYHHVARQKREWVREHLGADVTVLPVMGGHSKPLFMHAPGDILVDDWPKNIEAWQRVGGSGVLHSGSWHDTVELLSLAMSALKMPFPGQVARDHDRFATLGPDGRPKMPAGYSAPLGNSFVAEL